MLYILLTPYLCFIFFLYLDLYVLGDDALISKGIFHANQTTSALRVWLVSLNIFKPLSIFITDCSKAVLLLWIIFVIYVSCLSLLWDLVCSLLPRDHLLGKGQPLGSLV